MKRIARRCIQAIVANNVAWKIIGRPIAVLGNSLSFWRERHVTQRLAERFFADGLIQSGLFAGLRYPRATGLGGAVYPRLLGTYENELHPALRFMLSRKPELIVDIGCAEGLYAVGLAYLLPHARVVAFDINLEARAGCRELAEINGIGNRLQISSKCTNADLIELCCEQRALVICDCEGFEEDLFDLGTAQALRQCDLIIELHDFIRAGVTSRIQRVFSPTHHVELIRAVVTSEKVANYSGGPTWDALMPEQRTALIDEHRPALMQWLVATAR